VPASYESVAPNANPYLVMLAIFKSGIDSETSKIKNLRQAERYLPDKTTRPGGFP
jgi:glutamine synthetase